MTVDHRKLERRIHNQRVQLRLTWEIVEQRADNRVCCQHPRWFRKVLEQGKELRRLRAIISEVQNDRDNFHAETTG